MSSGGVTALLRIWLGKMGEVAARRSGGSVAGLAWKLRAPPATETATCAVPQIAPIARSRRLVGT